MLNYEITALNSLKDNYIWVIHNATSAIVVDPGSAQTVIQFLQKNSLNLKAILLTHNHADHNAGVDTLRGLYPDVNIIENSAQLINDNQQFTFDDFPHFYAITTPGHVYEHVCYVFDNKHLFCGDTLFSLGCGRVFTGDYVAAHTSLNKIKQLDKNILCYPAHEYTTSNLRFTATVDENRDYYADFAKYLVMKLANEQNSLPTLLDNELKYNLFLRCNEDYVQQIVGKKSGADCRDELSCFIQLRELRNKF